MHCVHGPNYGGQNIPGRDTLEPPIKSLMRNSTPDARPRAYESNYGVQNIPERGALQSRNGIIMMG